MMFRSINNNACKLLGGLLRLKRHTRNTFMPFVVFSVANVKHLSCSSEFHEPVQNKNQQSFKRGNNPLKTTGGNTSPSTGP